MGENANGRYFAWYFVREHFFELGTSHELYDAVFKISQSFDNEFLFEEVSLLFSFEKRFTIQNAYLI